MGAYKRYKVIDRLQEPDYEQWIGSLVQKALRKGKIDAEEVEIYDRDRDKAYFLKVDGKRYVLYVWDYTPYTYDSNEQICAESVEYALHEQVFIRELKDNCIMCEDGDLVSWGKTIIKWDNNKRSERALQIEE